MDAKLIEELVGGGYEPCRKCPDDFGVTVKEYMDIQHCSSTVARKLLDKAVEAGVLEMHLMRTEENKNPSAVYHRPKEWPPKVTN